MDELLFGPQSEDDDEMRRSGHHTDSSEDETIQPTRRRKMTADCLMSSDDEREENLEEVSPSYSSQIMDAGDKLNLEMITSSRRISTPVINSFSLPAPLPTSS